MSFSDIYQYSTDVNGRFVMPTKLGALQDVAHHQIFQDGIARIYQQFAEQKKVEDAVIKSKYASVKASEPQTIGSGWVMPSRGGIKPAQIDSSADEEAPPSLKKFSFGFKKR